MFKKGSNLSVLLTYHLPLKTISVLILKETILAIIPVFVGLRIGFMTWPYLSEEHKVLVGRVHDNIIMLFKDVWSWL